MMQIGLALLLANIPAVICYSWAAFLMHHNSQYWGWMIVAGLALTFVPKD